MKPRTFDLFWWLVLLALIFMVIVMIWAMLKENLGSPQNVTQDMTNSGESYDDGLFKGILAIIVFGFIWMVIAHLLERGKERCPHCGECLSYVEEVDCYHCCHCGAWSHEPAGVEA